MGLYPGGGVKPVGLKSEILRYANWNLITPPCYNMLGFPNVWLSATQNKNGNCKTAVATCTLCVPIFITLTKLVRKAKEDIVDVVNNQKEIKE